MTSLDEVRAAIAKVLPRIEMRRWPWMIEAHATLAGPEVIFIRERVPERDTGQMTELGGMIYGVPPNLADGALVTWIYRQYQRHVLHELAEAFHLDGVRVCDPHASELSPSELDDMLQAVPAYSDYADRTWGAAEKPSPWQDGNGNGGTIPPASGGSFLSVDEIEKFAKDR